MVKVVNFVLGLFHYHYFPVQGVVMKVVKSNI